MCGRFSLAGIKELSKRFQIEKSVISLKPRYNIAPGQDIPVIVKVREQRILTVFRWGLIPSWAKDSTISNKLINARAETIDTKPSFKYSLKTKRCLIPADGFYEWKKEGKIRRPYRIILKNGDLFAFAGLWDTWVSSSGEIINSCTIITTPSNSFLRPFHDRMPVILSPEQEKGWCDCNFQDVAQLKAMLKPCPVDWLDAYEVSPLINSVKVDDQRCIAMVNQTSFEF